MSKLVKIQIIGDYQDYKKGQIVELDEKVANTLLTNSRALRIHRKTTVDETPKTEGNSEEKTNEKGNKKSK